MSIDEDSTDDISLAGEYVLHLVDAEERKVFELRLAREPHLRMLVHDWESHFALLAQDIRPVTPPASIKRSLEQKLFAEKQPRKSGVWRMFGAVAIVTSLLVIGLLLKPEFFQEDELTSTLSALVVSEDGSFEFAADFFDSRNDLKIVRKTGHATAGRALELWLIAKDEQTPVSLGLLSDEPVTSLNLSPELVAKLAGALLAISDEPMGGSPTGLPTGAVLATGMVSGI